MDYGQPTETRFFAIGIVASLMLHAFAALAFMDGVDPHDAPAAPEAVEVELVPPPPPPPVTPEPEEPEPEEPEPEEEPEETEPPAQEELPPEPEPAPAEEQTDLQEEEQLAEEIPVLQPVEEFGEEDSAPEDSDVGAPEQAAEEESEEPKAAKVDESTDEQEPVEDELDVADEALSEDDEPAEDTSEGAEDEPATEDTGEAETVDNQAPEEPQPETDAVVVEDESLSTDFGTVGEIVTSATPTAKPKPRSGNGGSGGGQSTPSRTLPKAQRLFSGHFTADPRVRSAMNGMPPGERMNLLCITELREQLHNEVPPFIPDRLPNFRPQKGTVLEPGRAAFRSFGIWYDVAFRCEVDSAVKRVENFSYKVGKPIPRSQWAERRLPAN
ncbi:MAG: DUF930 domain-containing protein [Roseibium sp.]